MKTPRAFKDITTDDLPKGLREIAELVGLHSAVELARVCGGTRIIIPAVARPDSPIARAVGSEGAAVISKRYAGEQVYIPSAASILRRRRDAAIVRAYEKGKTAPALSRQHGLTERQVRGIIAKARQ